MLISIVWPYKQEATVRCLALYLQFSTKALQTNLSEWIQHAMDHRTYSSFFHHLRRPAQMPVLVGFGCTEVIRIHTEVTLAFTLYL